MARRNKKAGAYRPGLGTCDCSRVRLRVHLRSRLHLHLHLRLRLRPSLIASASPTDQSTDQYVMRTPSITLRPGSGATDEMNDAWL